ncbi:MAG: DUF2993 domain-containing protein [Cyanobacteria bacterium J06621_11]
MSDKNLEREEVVSEKGGSRLIGRLLPPAVRFYLRSQVDQAEQLTIDLDGRDRQIITGYLPGVSVSARQVIYDGIHVDAVQLSAKGIRINVGQIIRGKPLRLLKSFPVAGQISLRQADLDASLRSPLLKEGLLNFWRSLIQIPAVAQDIELRYGRLPVQADVSLLEPTIRLGQGCLGFSFYPATSKNSIADFPVVLATQLSISAGQYLLLTSPVWLSHIDEFDDYVVSDAEVGNVSELLEGFKWDLGEDTELTQLDIQPSQLACCGQVLVRP